MEHFNAETVALVTGYSVGSVIAWAHKYRGSSKDGLTVPDVIEFLNAPKKDRGTKPDEKAAERLRIALEVMGALTPTLELRG